MFRIYRKLSFELVLLYLLIMFFFLLFYNSSLPSNLHIFIQSIVCFSFLILSTFIMRNNVSKFACLNALFVVLLFLVILFRAFQIHVFDHPLGYNPMDSLYYHNLASEFCSKKHSVFGLREFLLLKQCSIDDSGFIIIACLTYKLFGSDLGIHILVLFNVCVYIAGCSMLYKLSKKITNNIAVSKFSILLWGTFTYSIYTATTGLKENFFAASIIMAMLCLYNFLDHKNIYRLLLFLLASSLSIFFRLPIFYILIVTLMVSVFLQFKFVSKHIRLWMTILIICAIMLYPLAISYIIEERGGMALNQEMLDSIDSGENIYVYMGTAVLTAFVGAVPNFIADVEKLNYITLWNFGTFIKIALSGYFLYAVCNVIRNRDKKFYPLLVFIGLHIVMLIVTMFSIHDRYQMPQLPFVYLLTGLGVLNVSQSQSKTVIYLNKVYLVGTVIFVVLFNIYRQ